MEAKALTFQPVRVRKELEEARAKSIEQGAEGDKQAPEVSDRLAEIAAGIHAKLGDTVPEKDLLQKMNSNETFTYLARSVDPAVAAEISDKFREGRPRASGHPRVPRWLSGRESRRRDRLGRARFARSRRFDGLHARRNRWIRNV